LKSSKLFLPSYFEFGFFIDNLYISFRELSVFVFIEKAIVPNLAYILSIIAILSSKLPQANTKTICAAKVCEIKLSILMAAVMVGLRFATIFAAPFCLRIFFTDFPLSSQSAKLKYMIRPKGLRISINRHRSYFQ
jgi:hypothetical protein